MGSFSSNIIGGKNLLGLSVKKGWKYKAFGDPIKKNYFTCFNSVKKRMCLLQRACLFYTVEVCFFLLKVPIVFTKDIYIYIYKDISFCNKRNTLFHKKNGVVDVTKMKGGKSWNWIRVENSLSFYYLSHTQKNISNALSVQC